MKRTNIALMKSNKKLLIFLKSILKKDVSGSLKLRKRMICKMEPVRFKIGKISSMISIIRFKRKL
jgi:hypothetical protein